MPDVTELNQPEEYNVMRVASDPFSDGRQVWFWSESDNCLYLNLSCKDELDLVFLKKGQDISSKGNIQMENVHVKWICESCGNEIEIRDWVPCRINKETRIRLMKVGER